MEVVNMFDDDWEENYGDPLEGLNSNPSCCENELFYFNGKVKQISGNKMVVNIDAGLDINLEITVCSKLYKTNEHIGEFILLNVSK